MKDATEANEVLRKMARHPDLQPLEDQEQDLKRQIAEVNSKKRAIIHREMMQSGLIGKRVLRGQKEYVITGYRLRMAGYITLRGKLVKKDGTHGAVEVDMGGWTAK